jgi:8-oxo-dGTP diphosphatase
MRIWLAEVVEGTPEPLVEHDELRWLAPHQWHDVPWLDADVRIVDRLADLSARLS